MTEVIIDPVLFVCEGEGVCSLEAIPYPESSTAIFCLRYNAASISLMYLISEDLCLCPRAKGFHPGDSNLIGYLDRTVDNDEIVAGVERSRVSWERLAVICLDEIMA